MDALSSDSRSIASGNCLANCRGCEKFEVGFTYRQ